MHVSRETSIPDLTPEAFGDRLAECVSRPLDPAAVERLYIHFQELARWNQRLSLVGPGTAEEVVIRHFGESLAALPLLPDVSRETSQEGSGEPPVPQNGSSGPESTAGSPVLVDIGSGGGFPGLVLALALPDWEVFLVESRTRKLEFLRSVTRKAQRPVNLLADRFELPLPRSLPETVDCLTLRAVRLPEDVWQAASRKLRVGGRILIWCGVEEPAVPAGLKKVEEVPLTGSRSRRIVVWQAETNDRGANT